MATIADFLELDDDEFDINEACEFYRDVSIELSSSLEFARTLKKLESRIKSYVKEYGEMPNVSGINLKIINKNETLRVRPGATNALYEYLLNQNTPDDIMNGFFVRFTPEASIRIDIE